MNILFDEWMNKAQHLDPEYLLIKKDLLNCLQAKIEKLTAKEKLCLKIIFERGESIESLMYYVGCSRHRTSQILRWALFHIMNEVDRDPVIDQYDLFDLLSTHDLINEWCN